MQIAKQVAREVLDSLPDDCTLDDICNRLELNRKLERSDKAIEEGRVHSYEEAKEIVASWGVCPQRSRC